MGRYDEKETFESLVGKTIKEVMISGDGVYIVFVTEDGKEFGYGAEGDCCSSSWFSHITGLKNLIGQNVVAVSEREEFSKEEYEEAEKEGEYDVLELYGFTLKTNKGACDIEMRNDSNGYYGGMVYTLDRVTKDIKEDLKPVEEDI